jgi:hypothetical protein
MGKGSTRAGRLVTTGILGLASAGALSAAFLAVGTQAASAGTISSTLTYSCSIGGALTFPVPIVVAATAPASVAPSGAVSLTGVQASASIPASTVKTITSVTGPIKSIGGTITGFEFIVAGGTPSTVNAAATPISFTVPVKTGAPAVIIAPASPTTVSGFTAGASGTLSITPGNIIIAATVPKLGSVTVTCTAPSSASSDALSVAISSGGGSTTPTTVAVPASHTGEPWAGWPYWLLVAMFGFAGLFSLERAVRIRRQKA